MSGRVIAVQVGDVEVLVETARVAGTEDTSSGGRVQKVADAFDRAKDSIVAVSTKVAQTVNELADAGARPDRVDVEFGLKFTTKGGVIVASGSAEVALKVVIGYEAAARQRIVAADEEPDDSDPV